MTDKRLAEILDIFIGIMKDNLNASKYKFGYGYKGQKKSKYGTAPKRATGKLVDTITKKVSKEGDETYGVVLLQDYYVYVNEGRKPGKFAPIDPLTKWSKIKFGVDEDDARSIAFGVSTNLKKYGILPTNFYDDALAELEDIIEDEIEDFEDKLLEDILNL